MSKQYAIQVTLKKMTVGQTIHFPTHEEQRELEVERIFSGTETGWVIRMDQERKVVHDVQEVAQMISTHWNPSLKKVLRRQYLELDEVEDLGEF